LQAALGLNPHWAPIPHASIAAAENAALAAERSGADPLAAAAAALPPVGTGFVTGAWPVGGVSYLMVPLRPKGAAEYEEAVRDEIRSDAVLARVLLGDEGAGGVGGGGSLESAQASSSSAAPVADTAADDKAADDKAAAPYAIDWLFFRELAIGALPAAQFIKSVAAADERCRALFTPSGSPQPSQQQGWEQRRRRRALVDALWPAAKRLAEGPLLLTPEECLAAVMEGAGAVEVEWLGREGVVGALRERAVVTQHRGQVGGCLFWW